MPTKKKTSSAKQSPKAGARVKDLSASKEGSAQTKGGTYSFKQGWPRK